MVSKLVFNSSELWAENSTSIETIDAALFWGGIVSRVDRGHILDENNDSEERECDYDPDYHEQDYHGNLNLMCRVSQARRYSVTFYFQSTSHMLPRSMWNSGRFLVGILRTRIWLNFPCS